MLTYQLIARARGAGLDVYEVNLGHPRKKTVIVGANTTITIWPSGMLSMGTDGPPVTVDNAARYLGLIPRQIRSNEQ